MVILSTFTCLKSDSNTSDFMSDTVIGVPADLLVDSKEGSHRRHLGGSRLFWDNSMYVS